MKRTLALLIAVLMVVAMLPTAVFAAAGQELVGGYNSEPQGNPAPGTQNGGQSQTPPEATSDDYFAVYDAEGAWVGYYAELADADAALADGYTLKVLQSFTFEEAYIWGESRANVQTPISFTIDGALADGGNAVITSTSDEGAWAFQNYNEQVTLKNVTIVAAAAGVAVVAPEETLPINFTLENCQIYAGNSYYEVNPSAYQTAPATNDAPAVASLGAVFRILGEDTVLRATEGQAFMAMSSYVYVENGYFYTSAGVATFVTQLGDLYVTDAAVVNNVQFAVMMSGTEAIIHGGQYALTAAETMGAAVMATNAAQVAVTNALVVGGENVIGCMTDGTASIAVYASTVAVGSAAQVADGNISIFPDSTATPNAATAQIEIVGDVASHKIDTAFQMEITLNALAPDAVTAFRVYNAAGDLIAYSLGSVPALPGEVLSSVIKMVPNGGKLVLDQNIDLSTPANIAYAAPQMSITVEGNVTPQLNGEVIPIMIAGDLDSAPAVILDNNLNITMVNVAISNDSGPALKIGSGDNPALIAKDAKLTLGENAALISMGSGEVLFVGSGATVVMNENCMGIGAYALDPAVTKCAVLLEGGATFEMNGGALMTAAEVFGVTLFQSTAITRSETIDEVTYSNTLKNTTIILNAGDITVPGDLSSLHQLSENHANVDMKVGPEANFFTASTADDGTEPFQFNNTANAVELFDETGTHVAYYDRIADALADVKDGYTVKLLADHLETGYFNADFEDITWNFDGNGFVIYMPQINFRGMEFSGKNTTANIQNFVLYAAGYGIFLNPANDKAGIAVVATDVFVYGAGSSDVIEDAYVVDPVRTAAFRVNGKGAGLVLQGEGSGAYLNGLGKGFTYLLYNAGFLAVQGGSYTGVGMDYLVETIGATSGTQTVLDHTTTYISGGTFENNTTSRFMFRSYSRALTIVTGGKIVTKGGVTFRVAELNGTAYFTGHYMVFGGEFYHLSASALVGYTGGGENSSAVLYYGGTFYAPSAADADTFLCLKTSTSRFNDEARWFYYGVVIGEGYKASLDSYTAVEGDVVYGLVADQAYAKVSIVENDAWLTQNGFTSGDYTLKAYTGNGGDFVGIYGTDLSLATYAVAEFGGKIELQKNVDIIHSALTFSRVLGPAGQVTITSTPGNCFTYASSHYKAGSATGDQYFLILNGGTWTLDDITLANYGSQLLQMTCRSLSRTTLVMKPGSELSGHTSVLLLADNSAVVVEEGAFLNVSANQNPANVASSARGKLPGSSNILRLENAVSATIYGSLGFYRDGSLPDNGSYRCINYNGAGDAIKEGAGGKCEVYIAPTAKLGTPIGATDKGAPVINIAYGDYTTVRDTTVVIDGASFYTDSGAVVASAGAKLLVDGAKFYNADPTNTGSFAGAGYTFTMNGAGGEFKNIVYDGSSFMDVNSCGMAKEDIPTIVFGEGNVISTTTNTLFIVMEASCNTDVIINAGDYHNQVNGNLFYGVQETLGAAPSEGMLTINGGYFHKDNGAGMFKMQGSYDVTVNGGKFETTASSLFAFSYKSGTTHEPASGRLIINDGEFIHCAGYIYQNDNATDVAYLEINGGYFYSGSGKNYAGNTVQPSGGLLVRGNSNAEINGGTFETEEYAAVKHCITLWTQHTAHAVVNDWTVIYRVGEESPVRVEANSTVEIYGGWIESNARYVARTMGGSCTSAGVLKTESQATLKIYGGTMILHPMHQGKSDSAGYAVVGNGGSEQFGHVYIYGGIFVNNRDGAPMTPDSNYSREVFIRGNALGGFQIYGGTMIATPVQDFFYKTSTNSNSQEPSIPSIDLPIVKGLTPRYEIGGREYYYSVYGAGQSLLVPEIESAVEADITENGNGLIFKSVMDSVHYDALLTWARSQSYTYNGNADNYQLGFGTLITTADALIMTQGVFNPAALEEVGAICIDVPATATDILPNEDGSLDIHATVANIAKENNTVQYVALPYLTLTVGVGTAQQTTVRYYGEFNVSAGVASMASMAAAILRDNTDIAIGAYQYPSITVQNAFNRYTVEQQEILKEYLAHEHSFDYKGVCQAEGCTYDAAIELVEGENTNVYAESGLVKFYKMTLKKDVTYSIGLTRDLVTYKIYDETGALCEVSSDSFTAAADGVYYLRVDGKRAGTTVLTVSHIHSADYTGLCTVCEQELSVVIGAEQLYKQPVVKNNMYFYNVVLEANINYTIAAVNGTYHIFNAEGVEQTVEESIFKVTEAGTYYIISVATYTAEGSILVAHIHEYDHTGLCKVESCGEYEGVTLSNVYKYSAATKVAFGDKMFFNINMEAGKTYAIAANRFVGLYALYNAAGDQMQIGSGDTFACETAGVYYLVVDVQTNVSAQIRFEYVHECVYSNKGECEFTHVNAAGEPEKISCGKTDRIRLMDGQEVGATIANGVKTYFFVGYASKNVVYRIEMPTTVTYQLCDENGTVIDPVLNGPGNLSFTKAPNADGSMTNDAYIDVDTQRTLYLVVTTDATEPQPITVKVTHEHQINHRGQCSVKDTTLGTPATPACAKNDGKVLSTDTETAIVYAANGNYYYELYLNAGVEYTVSFAAATATWTLTNLEGEPVYTSTQGDTYLATEDGYYYLVVTATAESTGTEDVPATIKVAAHQHTINNKGECSAEDCDYTAQGYIANLDDLTAMGGTSEGQLKAGTYYFSATMVAGKTYKLAFSVAEITYKLYSGENADVEVTVTDGSFACTEAGVYHYVVVVPQNTAQHDTITYTVTDTPAAE